MNVEKSDILASSVERLRGFYWLIDSLLVSGNDKPISGLNDDELSVIGQCLEMIVDGVAKDLESIDS